MANTNELLNRINRSYSTMSKGQKLLATYITDNYDKAVFLTAARMGETVGVSESTVVRFATCLGYKGYPEFQRALEELVRNKLNSVQRMEVTSGRISQSKILETVLQSDADKIKTTLEKIDHDAFELAVKTILGAKNIYIVGIRSCAPLASFLGFYLNLMFSDVHLLTTNSSSELFEQMVRIGQDDVIIGISFPRYSMRTLKALEFANNRSAKVITITDSIHSPMNLYSSCNLIADSDMASIVDSLVAPLSVINALIVALCMARQEDVAQTLTMLEDIWDEYQVYENDEINYVDDSIKAHYAKIDDDGGED
ncbi:MAG: MurR/RpiR family transcriptional regulator [Clostridiales bacterium]|nr:MurR/RpiR family transcriptional regulator [Clostridiales bacterium]